MHRFKARQLKTIRQIACESWYLYENVTCGVNVRITITKPSLLHAWLHDVDMTICKLKNFNHIH